MKSAGDMQKIFGVDGLRINIYFCTWPAKIRTCIKPKIIKIGTLYPNFRLQSTVLLDLTTNIPGFLRYCQRYRLVSIEKATLSDNYALCKL